MKLVSEVQSMTLKNKENFKKN